MGTWSEHGPSFKLRTLIYVYRKFYRLNLRQIEYILCDLWWLENASREFPGVKSREFQEFLIPVSREFSPGIPGNLRQSGQWSSLKNWQYLNVCIFGTDFINLGIIFVTGIWTVFEIRDAFDNKLQEIDINHSRYYWTDSWWPKCHNKLSFCHAFHLLLMTFYILKQQKL